MTCLIAQHTESLENGNHYFSVREFVEYMVWLFSPNIRGVPYKSTFKEKEGE